MTPTGAREPATREHGRVASGAVDVTTKIVIAGGGFAGLYAAMHLDRTLARRREADVVLISRESFSVFTPMLHEVAAALGADTNLFDMAGVRDWTATMKSLGDAVLLHNTMVALLETAALQEDASARRPLLTFVIAGGGFAGVETTGAVNDFVNEAALHYPSVAQADIRVVLIHPESFLLPELGEELARYAERKLRERNVDVVTGEPSAVIASLPCETERGRVRVDDTSLFPG